MIFGKGRRENDMFKSVYPENHAYPTLHMGKIGLNLFYYDPTTTLVISTPSLLFDPFASVIPSEARNLSIYAQGRLREKSLTICFCSKISRRLAPRNDI